MHPRSVLAAIDRRRSIFAFVIIQLAGYAAAFAITLTIAAIGFPIIFLLLILARTWILLKFFSRDDLKALDAPTASPFTMESVGRNYEETLEGTGVSDERTKIVWFNARRSCGWAQAWTSGRTPQVDTKPEKYLAVES